MVCFVRDDNADSQEISQETLSSHGFKKKSCEGKPGYELGHVRFEGLVERVGDRQPSKKHCFGWEVLGLQSKFL